MCWYQTYPLAYMPAVLFFLLAAILATAINISLYLENIGTIAMMKVFTIGFSTNFYNVFDCNLASYIHIPPQTQSFYIYQQLSLS